MSSSAWPTAALPDDKAAARRAARDAWKSAGAEATGDGAITRLLDSGLLDAGRVIAIYRTMNSETSLGPLATAEWAGRTAYVRAAADGSLSLVRWDGRSGFERDEAGMEVPAHGTQVGDASVDIVLVPGLAFDAEGWRLGRGKGFYDRFLARVPRALRIAVTAECALFASVPVDAHDQPVDLVITPERTHRTDARGR